MTVCDGCGRQVDAQHVKDRIARLEMATRFRPIHIQTLVIDACPPPALGDFFYNAGPDGRQRSAMGRTYFDELAKCSPDSTAKEAGDEAVLSEWQRRGLFLAYVLDCHFDSAPELESAISKSGKTTLLRLSASYKPKTVALISGATTGLLPVLRDAGWADKLILDSDAPFRGAGFGMHLAPRLLRAVQLHS
jgi:hypothetical protein